MGWSLFKLLSKNKNIRDNNNNNNNNNNRKLKAMGNITHITDDYPRNG